MMLLKLALILAFTGTVAAQSIGIDTPGIFNIDFSFTNLNPGKTATSNTQWQLTASRVNFNFIVGFEIFLYFKDFSNSDIVITSFTDPNNQISFVPGSTEFSGNGILGGELNPGVFPVTTGPVFISPNCDFDDATALPECEDIVPEPFIIVDFTTPSPAVADDLLVGGDPTISNENPRFALFTIVDPEPTEDEPVPAPTPTPVPESTPAPNPAPARTLSDPHVIGLQGQQYEFTGEPGKIYSFIYDRDLGLVVNAKFEQAYTSGVSTDEDTFVIRPYHAKGTWVTEVGIVINDNRISASVNSLDLPCIIEGCLRYGQVTLNDQPIIKLGQQAIDDDVTIALENSKSFSRMTISSDVLLLKVDIVSPPVAWNILETDLDEYSHINLVVDRVILLDGAGVLGETSQPIFDDFGEPILKAKGDNGEGILRRSASGYVVSGLYDILE